MSSSGCAIFCIIASNEQQFLLLCILASIQYCQLFWILVILIDVCVMVPHCGFNLHLLNENDVEHLSICLFAILISSLVNCLFRFFHAFKNWVVSFLLNFKRSLYIFHTTVFSDMWFASRFSNSMPLHFILSTMYVTEKKL